MVILSARGVRKYFPETGALANDGISLDLSAGEIKAVIGENGAGKSTFARVLAGLVAQDEGSILVRGARLRPGSVREAEAAGIGFVPQYSLLAGGLSLAENLALGREPRRFGLVFDRRRAYVEAALLAERFGIRFDPEARVDGLSPPERRQGEIIRALSRGGEIIVLDEPTSILSESEAETLFSFLRRLAGTGKAVLFITHRAAEVARVADSIAVLREGRVVAELEGESTDAGELSSLMSRSGAADPRPTAAGAGRRPREREPAEELGRRGAALVVSGLRLARDSRPISFSVSPGEVLGVAALAGNGLDALEDYVSGFRAAPRGAVLLDGEELSELARGPARAELVAYVPADRDQRGLSLGASVRDNLLALRRRRFGAWDYLAGGRRDLEAAEMATAFSLEAGIRRRADSLSGGNRQRLLLARELDRPRRLAVLAEPFQNLDLRSQEELAGRIRGLAEAGSAVLLLCSGLEELMPIAHRIAVLYRGSLAHIGVNEGPAAAGALLARMTGLRAEGAA